MFVAWLVCLVCVGRKRSLCFGVIFYVDGFTMWWQAAVCQLSHIKSCWNCKDDRWNRCFSNHKLFSVAEVIQRMILRTLEHHGGSQVIQMWHLNTIKPQGWTVFRSAKSVKIINEQFLSANSKNSFYLHVHFCLILPCCMGSHSTVHWGFSQRQWRAVMRALKIYRQQAYDLQLGNVQRNRLTQPQWMSRVIQQRLTSVWMQQCTQVTVVHHDPTDNVGEFWIILRNVDLEHGHWVWTDWLVEHFDTEFAPSTNGIVHQLFGISSLFWVVITVILKYYISQQYWKNLDFGQPNHSSKEQDVKKIWKKSKKIEKKIQKLQKTNKK